MKLPQTFAEVKRQVQMQEGTSYPGKALVAMELQPGYDRAKSTMIGHMLSINEAHLLMLIKQKIVDEEQGMLIMRELEAIDYASYKEKSYTGQYEDLFFEIEAELIQRTQGLGGNLHLGRSRNDMCLCLSHMVIREDLQGLLEQLITLENTVLKFAQQHKETLYVVHTHTQHAQPSVLGHYFLGVFDMLQRDERRLRSAYHQVNRSPMGAAAINTSGFPLDRAMVSELIGCDDYIRNAYDAIGNSDFFTETASAMSLAALNIGRVVTDMTLWATEELHMIKVADGYISTSSIMPQKRNPIALEHLRSSLSLTKGLADSILLGFMKSPYGDISDYEDAEDPMAQATKLLSMNYRLFNAVLATLEVDEKTLTDRAYESFSVVTEMADQLYRAYHIPFRKAHHLVATLVKEAGKQNLNLKMLDESFFTNVYEQVMGKAFTLDFAPIKESLDPLAFVVKRDVDGGTSARAMQKMLDEAHQHLDESVAWFGGIMAQQQAAEEKRKALIGQLLNS